MSRIRAADTTPEITLRRALWQAGLRYRLHSPRLKVRPDLVFPKAKVAVFIDGCFWHGCPEHYVPPRSARPFWEGKLKDNVARDQRQTSDLELSGWHVLRFWEHEVFTDLSGTVERIRQAVRGNWAPTGTSARVVRVDFLDRRGNLEKRHLTDLRDDSWSASVVRDRSTRKW
jgi:DNA mismatch endonuclease (patch repair protein)